MRVLGIIAEYNPFHKGHLYHLQQSQKQVEADYTVVVMSGDFVQRGEPALCNKWKRAEMAVRCGVDLVLELPFVYACNNAEYFAKGAVRILNQLGCVTHLSFGSELGDLSPLKMMAEQLVKEKNWSTALKKYTGQGDSFAVARQKALAEVIGTKQASLLKKANNILAVEYLKQLILSKSDIIPITVKREGSAYCETEVTSMLPSAMALRASIAQNNDIRSIAEYIPWQVENVLRKAEFQEKEKQERLYQLLLSRIIVDRKEQLAEIFSVTEGIENRLKTHFRRSQNLSDFLAQVKTKRYAMTRINRLCMHILLDLTKNDFMQIDQEDQLYGRVLAFNAKGTKLLRTVKNKEDVTLPLLTNINKEALNNDRLQKILNYDIKASDLFHLINGEDLYLYADMVKKPYYHVVE